MPKDLKALQAIWYKKLADSGFKDIEKDEDSFVSGDGYHSSWFYYLRDEDYTNFEAREEYYRRLTHYINEHRFPPTVREVLQMHSEGISVRLIGEKTGKTRQQIRTIIKKHVNRMLGREKK